jgi:hypothetical protein
MFKNEDYRYAGFLSAFSEHGSGDDDYRKVYILFPKYNRNNSRYFENSENSENRCRFKCPSDMTPGDDNSRYYPLFSNNAIKSDFESCELIAEIIGDNEHWTYLCL